MTRTPHFHVIDTSDGDWGAYDDQCKAQQATLSIVAESAQYFDEPMTPDELTTMASDEWCAQDDAPCYYDRNAALAATVKQTPEWTYHFPAEPLGIYRINGRRVPRWRLASSLSTDRMHELWPFTGHPVALPQWRFDAMIMDPALCTCATRSHRKKECAIGPKGRKCSICGALFEDYGNSFGYCRPCDEWKDQRERYLADWAVTRLPNSTLVRQLSLI